MIPGMLWISGLGVYKFIIKKLHIQKYIYIYIYIVFYTVFSKNRV